MLRVGIIGLGTISAVHLDVIRRAKNVQLVAACDLDDDKRGLVPECHFYQDAENMLKSEQLDVVHLCLPHYLHVPMALLANHYRCHVLLEKPLGISVNDGSKLLFLEHPEYKIAICFQNRFNNTTLKLQQVLKETNAHIVGAKGLVIWNRGQDYYDAAPWRSISAKSGTGLLSNQAIHTIDLLQLFCGKFIDCKAKLLNLTTMRIEVEDTAVASLHFNKDIYAYFNATNSYVTDSSVELEVVTTNSKYLIHNGKLIEITDEGQHVLANDQPTSKFKSYYGSSHGRLIESFYQSIIENKADYISVAEALKSMTIIDAMVRSSEVIE